MLPNLPSLLGEWEWAYLFPTPAALTWVDAAPGDPCRWMISFEDWNGTSLTATTELTEFPIGGFVIPFGTYREIKYKDFGPVVGQPWYVWARGGFAPCTVFTASIRLRSYTEPRLKRLQREVAENIGELRDFIIQLLDKQEQQGVNHVS